MAAHQQTAREWWESRLGEFDLFISQFVIDEAALGDPGAAKRRLEVLADLPLLNPSEDVYQVANAIMAGVPLPGKAATDSLHIAVAAVNGMDHLLTWNCTHIANAEFRAGIENVCRDHGFGPPVICTPEELMKELI